MNLGVEQQSPILAQRILSPERLQLLGVGAHQQDHLLGNRPPGVDFIRFDDFQQRPPVEEKALAVRGVYADARDAPLVLDHAAQDSRFNEKGRRIGAINGRLQLGQRDGRRAVFDNLRLGRQIAISGGATRWRFVARRGRVFQAFAKSPRP